MSLKGPCFAPPGGCLCIDPAQGGFIPGFGNDTIVPHYGE